MSLYKGPRVPLSIRIPRSLHKKLKEIAKQRGISLNELAIQEFQKEFNRLMEKVS
jgi:predicted HicB family RNase H-like nuclease